MLKQGGETFVRKLAQQLAEGLKHLGEAMRAHPCHGGAPFPQSEI